MLGSTDQLLKAIRGAWDNTDAAHCKRLSDSMPRWLGNLQGTSYLLLKNFTQTLHNVLGIIFIHPMCISINKRLITTNTTNSVCLILLPRRFYIAGSVPLRGFRVEILIRTLSQYVPMIAFL